MEIGFVGLGRMGFNMTLRLLRAGHQVVATNRTPEKIEEAEGHGARGAASSEELARTLKPPRAVWAMVPAGPPVDDVIDRALPYLSPGDVFVDGGNSNYRDSRRRADRIK